MIRPEACRGWTLDAVVPKTLEDAIDARLNAGKRTFAVGSMSDPERDAVRQLYNPAWIVEDEGETLRFTPREQAPEGDLFLVMYKRPACYVDGETQIGIFRAVDGEGARTQAKRALGAWGDERDADRCLTSYPVGEMVQIGRERSNYRG